MKIAIAGYNIEGRSTYSFLKSQGHDLTILDQDANLEVPEGAPAVLGSNYLDNLDRFDLVVRTAGMPPQLILAKNPDIADKLTTHINLFLENSPTKNVIGVTGTKGKGTTATLIAKILTAAGHKTALGGNIGLPPLDFIDQLNESSFVVLELSSFQLIDIKQSPRIAVCLMIVPEHLNWHADIDEYTNAKANLFKYQAADDIAIYLASNELSKATAEVSPGKKIPYLEPPGAYIDDGDIRIDNQTVCRTEDLKLLGQHNRQNVCAAITAAWQVTKDITAMHSVLTSFSGLEHRLELVRDYSGIRYYDDSFGTTPETARVAIAAFKEPKVIILGGSDKKSDYSELALDIAADKNIAGVLLIGQTKDQIAQALDEANYPHYSKLDANNMRQIVATATELARTALKPNQPVVVLLSPASASFDMFKDYKDRGDLFKAAVQALA